MKQCEDEGPVCDRASSVRPFAAQEPSPHGDGTCHYIFFQAYLRRIGPQQRTDGPESRRSSARRRRDALGALSSPALAAAHHYVASGCTSDEYGCWRSLLQGWSAARWKFDVLHSVHISAGVRQRVLDDGGKCTMVEWLTSRAARFKACTLRIYR